MNYQLGRLRSPVDDRDLRAAQYMSELPEPPQHISWAPGQRWAMFGNDTVGDCTVASIAHQVQVWTLNSLGYRAHMTTPMVLRRYEEITGYIPGDPSTDTGANEREVLKHWLQNPLGGHSLLAFARVGIPEPLSPPTMRNFKTALWVFGGLYLGLSLPLTAQSQIAKKHVWDVTSQTGDGKAGTWGGHAVNAVSYSAYGVDVITWGRRQLCTWAFIAAYCEEAWAMVSPDWLNAGLSPQGFDLAALKTDLASVQS